MKCILRLQDPKEEFDRTFFFVDVSEEQYEAFNNIFKDCKYTAIELEKCKNQDNNFKMY